MYQADILWSIANGFLQGYKAKPPSEIFGEIRDAAQDNRTANDIKGGLISKINSMG